MTRKYVQCQTCFEELLADEQTKNRKQRHEEKHRRYGGIHSERDNHLTTNSNIKTKGEILWKTIYK